MLWLKLTAYEDDAKILVNTVNANSIISTTDGTYVCYNGSEEFVHVKESLEEIEAMLNKNEQKQMVEIVNPNAETVAATVIAAVKKDIAKEIGRDYIGSERIVEPWPCGNLKDDI